MDLIMSYPVIPGVTFLLILVFFGYQIRIIMKERRQSKTPKLPNIQAQNSQVVVKKVVIPTIQKTTSKNVAEIKKKYGPVAQFLSVLVLLLVVVSTVGLFYVYRNQTTPFVPRASGPAPTSPLLSLSPTVEASNGPSATPFVGLSPTLIPTLIPSATPVLLAKNITLAPTSSTATTTTITPAVSPTSTPTPIPTTASLTQTPTRAASKTSPSPTPAKSPSVITIIPFNTTVQNSPTPTPVLLTKNTLTITPTTGIVSPTLNVTTSITPKPSLSSIPSAGVPLYLGIFILGSLIFLAIGFVW